MRWVISISRSRHDCCRGGDAEASRLKRLPTRRTFSRRPGFGRLIGAPPMIVSSLRRYFALYASRPQPSTAYSAMGAAYRQRTPEFNEFRARSDIRAIRSSADIGPIRTFIYRHSPQPFLPAALFICYCRLRRLIAGQLTSCCAAFEPPEPRRAPNLPCACQRLVATGAHDMGSRYCEQACRNDAAIA